IIYRYERQTPDRMAALFVIELTNLLPAVTNSTGWLLGTFNSIWLNLPISRRLLGIHLYISIYAYNIYLLRRLSGSFNDYSLAKKFQIRENCTIMKCLLYAGARECAITSVGFSFFCYYEWGPTEWELSRYISFALFNLFTAIFCLFFYRAYNQNGFRV
ncbi:hypothetical protein PENTCL1PPCAC_14240, partial [Pristionchus entomophagus]